MNEAVQKLQELHRRDRTLHDELVRLNREEPQVRAELQQARLMVEKNTAGGFFDVSGPVAKRFQDAETALRKLEADRHAAVGERAAIASEIRDVVKESIGPIWQKLVAAREAEIAEGLAAGAALDKLIGKYAKAHAKKLDVQNDLEAFKNSVGSHIFIRLREELEAENPLPRVEDSKANRQNWKRALRLHHLACGDLTQTPIVY